MASAATSSTMLIAWARDRLKVWKTCCEISELMSCDRGPPRTAGVTKKPSERMNTPVAAAAICGASTGSLTRTSVRARPAPGSATRT